MEPEVITNLFTTTNLRELPQIEVRAIITHTFNIHFNTGHSMMFSSITNIYNKKTKGPALMAFFTATGKVFFFLQLEMFDVCTRGDTAHIDTIFKLLPHKRQRVWQQLEYHNALSLILNTAVFHEHL